MLVKVALVAEDQPLSLPLPDDATVGALRAAVCNRRGLDPLRNRVRLIFSGALLAKDHVTLAECGIRDGAVVHCAAVEAAPESPRSPSSPSSPPRPGDPLLGDLSPRLVPLTPHNLQALREGGFTQEQVASLTLDIDGTRVLFVPRRSVEPSHDADDDAVRQTQHIVLEGMLEGELEDAFGEPVIEDGTFSDFCWGAAVGLLLGLIALVLSLDRSVVLTRRFYTGVVAGTGLHIWLSLTMLVNQRSRVSM